MPFPETRVIPPGWSARHAPVASGAMTARCDVHGPGGVPVYDPATMSTTTPTGPALWSGACRVQAGAQQPAVGEQAGQQVTTHDYTIELDETAVPVPDVVEGSTVTVTACPADAHLIGRPLTVTGVLYGSERFSRVLVCSDNLG